MLSNIRNCIKQMTIQKYADRKESIEMFSKAMQSPHYTANSTTNFFFMVSGQDREIRRQEGEH